MVLQPAERRSPFAQRPAGTFGQTREDILVVAARVIGRRASRRQLDRARPGAPGGSDTIGRMATNLARGPAVLFVLGLLVGCGQNPPPRSGADPNASGPPPPSRSLEPGIVRRVSCSSCSWAT
jgi:hypothetical protein